jgi:O-antigen/teichoic acid export membrane protein/glycosyltransferase involved in cell wall biosynthesis
MNPVVDTENAQPTPRGHWPVALLCGLVSVLNTLLPLVLVRLLSPDDIGLFRIFFLYIAAVPVLFLSSGFLNGIAFWSGQGDRGRRALHITGLLSLCSGILAALVICLIPSDALFFQDWPVGLPLLFALAALGSISGFYFEEAAISSGRAWSGALFLSGSELLRTSSIVVSAVIWRDLNAVICAHTVVMLLKTLVGYALAARLQLFSFKPDFRLVAPVLSYAIPVSCAGILHLAINQVDKFILSTWLSNREFALYSIGCLSLGPLIMVEHSITRVMIPQLAELLHEKATSQAAYVYSVAIRQLGYFFIPATVGLIVFADPLLILLFTEKYAESAIYLRFYAIWYLFFLVPFDAVARASGDARWPLYTFAQLSVVSIPLTWGLTFYAGPLGALLAMLVSAGLLRVLTIRYTLQKTGWEISTLLPPAPLLAIAGLSVGGGMLALLLRPLFPNGTIWLATFALPGAVIVGLFAILVENSCRKSQPKVLFLVQSLQTGGIERLVVQLSTHIKSSHSQYHPRIFSYDQRQSSVLETQARQSDIPVFVQSKSNGLSLRLVLRLVLLSYREGIGLMHTHDLGGLIYASLARIVSLNRFRIVHTQHNFIHLGRSRKYAWYEAIFSRCASQITVVSPTLVEDYQSLGIATSSIEVITNGVQFPGEFPAKSKVALRAELNPKCSATPTDIWILYLARLYPQKGHAHALQLWKQLPSQFRARCRLLMLGPEAEAGYQNTVQGLIEQCPDKDRIHLAGGTDDPFSWIMCSDIFLSASESEGMPLSCIEAAGCGVPTLLSSIQGHSFLASQAELFDIEDPLEGARLLARLIETVSSEDYDPLAAWSQRSEFRVLYSFESMVRNYIKVYDRVLQRSMARSPRL